MTQPGIRFLFDENIGKPLVSELDRLLQGAEDQERATVKHVLDFQEEIGLQRQGVLDEVWIPKIVQDGWIVIASDRGKQGLKKGKKLPRLCVDYGVIHFILSPTIHHRKKFKKLLSLLSVWHELIILAKEALPGSRFMIEPTDSSPAACARAKITRRDTQPTSATPPPGWLFAK